MKTLRETELEIVEIPINEIVPYENNARIHSRNQIEYLKRSIEVLGNRKPIEIDEDNIILVGHGRLEAYKLLEMKTVPVIIHSDLTEEEKKAYRIADNETALQSEWDFDLLKLELEEIGDIGIEFNFFPEKIDYDAEWQGMPEYQNAEEKYKDIIVHLADEQALLDFAKLVKQNITPNTKYIYFPYKEREKPSEMGYVNDES